MSISQIPSIQEPLQENILKLNRFERQTIHTNRKINKELKQNELFKSIGQLLLLPNGERKYFLVARMRTFLQDLFSVTLMCLSVKFFFNVTLQI